jgi:hypothetical protein
MEDSTFNKSMIALLLIAITLIVGVDIYDEQKPKSIILKSTTPHEIRISEGDTTYIYKGELIR